MVLFILESIGTQELILIGLVALIFLGPRRLPEIARKIGKITADLRSTTSEFRSTWEREVNFEEEAKALRVETIESETATSTSVNAIGAAISTPEVKPLDMDRESFEKLSEQGVADAGDDAESTRDGDVADPTDQSEPVEDALSDKRSWL